ncbi:competence/damage-inducible protein A [Marinilabiliaceae bacterium ANBcel2]|nr:competence/damage-inducible protein A [Marinilabiliaceae bacterium ANBcel2]
MIVEIITIGDEILIGQVVDTNSSWIAKELNNIGLSVKYINTISDSEKDILDSTKTALKRSDILLITGGLGPTRDDITKKCLTHYFNSKLVFDKTVFCDIEKYFTRRNRPINQLNRDQALVPENAKIIRNPVGTAPSMLWLTSNNKVIVSMPGVPDEMKHAMSSEVIPLLKKRYRGNHVIHKTVHIFNIPEAELAEMLSQWEDNIPEIIKVAYLPSAGKLRLRLTGVGSNKATITNAIEKALNGLYPIIGDYIYGFDDEDFTQSLLNLLINNNVTLSCAESCSGGYISHKITSIPGASSVFKGGIVAYSDSLKINLLNVTKEILEANGAVSKEVVELMATSCIEKLNSDLSIAVSGIAGPSGGTEEKPVGTVWIAWASKKRVISKKFLFGAQRDRVILRTADAALILLKQFIENNKL